MASCRRWGDLSGRGFLHGNHRAEPAGVHASGRCGVPNRRPDLLIEAWAAGSGREFLGSTRRPVGLHGQVRDIEFWRRGFAGRGRPCAQELGRRSGEGVSGRGDQALCGRTCEPHPRRPWRPGWWSGSTGSAGRAGRPRRAGHTGRTNCSGRPGRSGRTWWTGRRSRPGLGGGPGADDGHQRRGGRNGWSAVGPLPYLDATYKTQLAEAVKTYVVQLDKDMAATPFGVPPSLRGWGGSGGVVDFGFRMYFLHKAFPDIVSPEYTLRAANYILGTHPASRTSYVSSVGTSSKLKAYGNNRADNTFIPGGVIPGYVIIKPDFPECIDDFGFLWFEHEYVIGEAASWILAANAADAIVR